MEKHSRRRLRSTSVQLGALTVLALTLAGCEHVDDDDDDDCASGPAGGDGRVVALAPQTATGTGVNAMSTAQRSGEPTGAVPERGGFGTHLAACGG